MKAKNTSNNLKASSYVLGFGLSLAITLLAYVLVVNKLISGYSLAIAIGVLAVTQLVVQLRLFLHLGKEAEPRWNLLVFDFMILIVVILVFGSLWIMFNLDYHHEDTMSPAETDTYLLQDEGLRINEQN